MSAVHTLSMGALPVPSLTALEFHIKELETEIRNHEFRMIYNFNQRIVSLDLLTKAKRQVERLKN